MPLHRGVNDDAGGSYRGGSTQLLTQVFCVHTDIPHRYDCSKNEALLSVNHCFIYILLLFFEKYTVTQKQTHFIRKSIYMTVYPHRLILTVQTVCLCVTSEKR